MNKESLSKLAHELLKKEVIFREDLELLFGKRLWDSNEKITLNPSTETSNKDTKDAVPEELKKDAFQRIAIVVESVHIQQRSCLVSMEGLKYMFIQRYNDKLPGGKLVKSFFLKRSMDRWNAILCLNREVCYPPRSPRCRASPIQKLALLLLEPCVEVKEYFLVHNTKR